MKMRLFFIRRRNVCGHPSIGCGQVGTAAEGNDAAIDHTERTMAIHDRRRKNGHLEYTVN